MEKLLENTQKAVERYHSKQAGNKMKAAKAVLSSVVACKNFIKENEGDDKGRSQAIARQLSEILAPMPMFRNLAADKETLLNNLEDKKVADEHLDKIQSELENYVKEFAAARKKKVHDWVKSHPVFGKLKRTAGKRLPKGSYILLFRKSAKPYTESFANLSEQPANVENETDAPSLLDDSTGTHAEQNHAEQNQHVNQADFVDSNSEDSKSVDSISPIDEQSGTSEQASIAEQDHPAESLDQPDESSDQLAESDTAASVVNLNVDQTAGVVNESPEANNSIEQATADANAQGQKPKHQGKNKQRHTKEHAPGGDSKGSNIAPELVIRPAPDGKVFTRFKPREFSDDTRMYRSYRGGPPIVGACVIVDGKLSEAIGILPQAADGGDQLRVLLSLSKEAVGKPGRAFIEANPVLNELFQLAKGRAIHKEAYVLLFQRAEDEVQHSDSDSDDDDDDDDDDDIQSDSNEAAVTSVQIAESIDETSVSSSDLELERELAELEKAAEPAPSEPTASENAEIESPVAQPASTTDSETSASSSAAISDAMADDDDQDDEEDAADVKCELVSKRTEDGRVITRFRTFDFSDARSLYENFRVRRTIVGAAIIRERELIKVMGVVPKSEDRRQLDVLLDCSRMALEKPALEFIATVPVLQGLYELANGECRQKECEVVLFHEVEGRLTIFGTMDKRGRPVSKGPIFDFRIPRVLFDRFKNGPAIVGASVIAEQAAPAQPREMVSKGAKDKGGMKSDSRESFRPRPMAPRMPVVLAAFGRTPLKQNVLLSAEILKRLGVDQSILEMAPPQDRFRDNRDSRPRDHRDNRDSGPPRGPREKR